MSCGFIIQPDVTLHSSWKPNQEVMRGERGVAEWETCGIVNLSNSDRNNVYLSTSMFTYIYQCLSQLWVLPEKECVCGIWRHKMNMKQWKHEKTTMIKHLKIFLDCLLKQPVILTWSCCMTEFLLPVSCSTRTHIPLIFNCYDNMMVILVKRRLTLAWAPALGLE